MKTHIVIPIGVGTPGTPVQTYLEQSVNSILNQSSQDFILTVAADTNIPDRCKEFLESKGVKIKWFETFSYFRKGGIWKKIFDTWKEEDTKYVAFLHYDDLWDSEKLKIQVDLMESKSLAGSYSEVMIMDDQSRYNPNDYSFPALTRETVGTRTMAFAHSCIINKEALFNGGILETEDKWSEHYYDKFSIGFEDIWAVFVHKLKIVERATGAKMFWRTHDMSVSNTFRAGNDLVTEQRDAISYNPNDIDPSNWRAQFNDIIAQIRSTL
jgi:hypothetical protein